ncbi:hypothetical protein P9112_007754 [Eukaryota sp. TZLM1-RC]
MNAIPDLLDSQELICSAICIFDFVAESKREMTVHTGQKVFVKQHLHDYKSSGWSKVSSLHYNSLCHGWIPSLYLSLDIDSDEAPPTGISKSNIKHDYLGAPPVISHTPPKYPIATTCCLQDCEVISFPIFTKPGRGVFYNDPKTVFARYPISLSQKLPVPILPSRLASWIYKHALTFKNLFRTEGAASILHSFICELDRSEFSALSDSLYPEVVASALKRYLRSLPSPLICPYYFKHYLTDFGDTNTRSIVRVLRTITARLDSNGSLLALISLLLHQVSVHNPTMDAKSLAVVFSPCFFGLSSFDRFFSKLGKFQWFTEQLIIHHEAAFHSMPYYVPTLCDLVQYLNFPPPLPPGVAPIKARKAIVSLSWRTVDPIKQNEVIVSNGEEVLVLSHDKSGYALVFFLNNHCFIPFSFLSFI